MNLTHPRRAFGAPPQGGAASDPAKRLRFGAGSCRESDVMPKTKPVTRPPLDRGAEHGRRLSCAAYEPDIST
jgi:hypothetical protein